MAALGITDEGRRDDGGEVSMNRDPSPFWPMQNARPIRSNPDFGRCKTLVVAIDGRGGECDLEEASTIHASGPLVVRATG